MICVVRAALVWLFLATVAGATQDRWPALFDVTGVADDDVLNIRAAPSGSAPIIGSFGPRAVGIEAIGPNDARTWAQVNTGEGTGWVSLKFLARQPGQWLGAIPTAARCGGTEPFWSLNYSDAGLVWQTPETPAPIAGAFSTASSLNARDGFWLTGSLQGTGAVTAHIRLQSCSDGMSDRAYGMRVDMLLRGDVALSGCCSLTAP